MAALGLVVLRLVLAAILAVHGAHELFGMFAGAGAGPGGLTSTAAHYTAIGLEPGFALAVLSGALQLAGGAFIAIGLLTRWFSIALILHFGLLIWKEQARWGFFMNWVLDPTRGHGYELSVILIGALGCLAFAGGGDLSVDGRRARSAASRASARARLRTRS